MKGYRTSSLGKRQEINLRLAVMAAVNPEGYDHTLASIADVCGVSKEAVRLMERAALRSLREKFSEIGLRGNLTA